MWRGGRGKAPAQPFPLNSPFFPKPPKLHTCPPVPTERIGLCARTHLRGRMSSAECLCVGVNLSGKG